MIPTLIPDIKSPIAFFLSEYCGNHDKRGAIDRKQLFSLGPEHLKHNNRDIWGSACIFSVDSVYFTITIMLLK